MSRKKISHIKIDSEHFKNALNQKGCTIYKLAKDLGIDAPSLYGKIGNTRRFNLDDLFKILDHLNLKFEDLFKRGK